jgi:hypothetical protein
LLGYQRKVFLARLRSAASGGLRLAGHVELRASQQSYFNV